MLLIIASQKLNTKSILKKILYSLLLRGGKFQENIFNVSDIVNLKNLCPDISLKNTSLLYLSIVWNHFPVIHIITTMQEETVWNKLKR